MSRQEFQAEVMDEAEQMDEAQTYAESFGESLFQMMVAMNNAKVEELSHE